MLTESDIVQIKYEIKNQVRKAKHEANEILKITNDFPNAVDAGCQAVVSMSKALALQEMLDELTFKG